MGKRSYIFALLTGIAAAILLIKAHAQFSAVPPEIDSKKAIKQNTAKLTVKSSSLPQVRTADIVKHNPFHPGRGKQEEEKENPRTVSHSKAPNFELTGIYNFGDMTGAIILISASRYSKNKTEQSKRSFSLGEQVSDGFCLKKIGEDKVTLCRGSETIELELKKHTATPRSNQRKTANRNIRRYVPNSRKIPVRRPRR